MADFYTLLSVPKKASGGDIKTKYRQLSLKYHPDYGGSTEKMIALNEAYRVLSNPLLRREYDQKNETTSRPTSSAQSGGSAAYQQQSYSRPVYRPNPTAQPVYRRTQRYTQPTATQNPKDTSTFWSWFGVLAVVAIAFLSYQIFTTVQPSTNAASTTTTTTPTSSLTTPTTSTTEDPSGTDNTGDANTDTSTPTSTSSTGGFRRRAFDNETTVTTTNPDDSSTTSDNSSDTSTSSTSPTSTNSTNSTDSTNSSNQ
jgi:hypothetical protein